MAVFLFFIVVVSISAGMVSKAKDKKVDVKPNSVLKVSLDYPINERTSNNPFEDLDFTSFEPKMNLGLNDILKSIEDAKEDDNIKGIYIDAGIIPSGMATVEAIRNALIDFRTSGKFIVAYGEMLSQKGYYLASVADEIYVNPVGYMDFRGFGAELAFFKNMLEKLDIEAQVIYAGKYKSATEPFRLEKMSDANREQITAIITDVYEHFIQNIAKERKLSVTLVDSLADNMAVTDIDDAVKSGLIDGVAYYDEVIANLKNKVGTEQDEKLNVVSINKYGKGGGKADKALIKDEIAVLYAQGNIVDGEGEESSIGSRRMARAIKEIREDEDVKALVFRINSGGGSALASDVILREIQLAKQQMPVIVSMGDVAASGGYYIACAADTILAEPNTITGSIGVFGLLPNMKGFFNNKLGITFDGVKTGKYSDFGTGTRPLSADERQIIQVAIDTIYMTFKERVAAGRGMTMEWVDSIGRGRVWTGTQAKEIGLVDVIGGVNEAIAIAKAKAGLEEYKVKEYPKQKDPFEKIMEEFGFKAEVYLLKKQLGEYYPVWKRIEEIKGMNQVQARMPFDLEIY